MRLTRSLLLPALCGMLALCGCKAEVYSGLSEIEANNMMAILIAAGIETDKQSADDTFTISVEKEEMLHAIALLNDHGYPKETRASIGQVFQKSGLMSSPFEERVRYIYVLGEEVAQTLSQLDGVVVARVHVVLPSEPELGQPVKPSSAAVFIKHQPNVDLDFFVPQIRRLVSSSIEGLDYAAVTVVLAEAQPMKILDPATESTTVEVLPGLSVASEDADRFRVLGIVAVASTSLLLLSAAFAGLFYFRSRRGKRGGEPIQANALMEPS